MRMAATALQWHQSYIVRRLTTEGGAGTRSRENYVACRRVMIARQVVPCWSRVSSSVGRHPHRHRYLRSVVAVSFNSINKSPYPGQPSVHWHHYRALSAPQIDVAFGKYFEAFFHYGECSKEDNTILLRPLLMCVYGVWTTGERRATHRKLTTQVVVTDISFGQIISENFATRQHAAGVDEQMCRSVGGSVEWVLALKNFMI